MDFQLTERQREMMEMARDVYTRKLKPIAHDSSVEGIRRLRRAMAEYGLLGLNMPTQYGGLGLPLLDTVLMIQTLQACSSTLGGLAHRSSTGAVGAIAEFGTDAQREKLVTGV